MGAVYLPHEASDYYHEDIFEDLTDDIITIKAKYQVVLLGDFNSRVGLKNDVEYELDYEELCIDEKQMFLYFEEHNLMNRVNMDAYVNNNGKRLIELCKMSDLKIANGRIGRDKIFGNFTCHTSNGQSTIDYAIVSMELFPNIIDFYVDVLDKCLSDVHCPICLEMSFKTSTSNRNDNVTLYNNSKYVKEKSTTCRWKNYLGNQYTLSYETESIEKFQEQLHCIMYRLSYVSQEMIDILYEDMKSLFINPPRKVGIYKQYENNSKTVPKNLEDMAKPWFNNECEMLRKQYMSIKNSLKPENASDQQNNEKKVHNQVSVENSES